ncbi:MAG: lipopolysaccharide assembly protein LapB [Gammaproteobacteria bacterium]|nr:MAG: lipopolysaccharide assembly protein LapB [Gammaproteobacteria bacterium]
MFELLWLLLPVAAYSGWWMARRDKGERTGDPSPLAPDYFKGLNYLLNEQPDKALGVFIKMVEVDGETVETHLALGNLYRRRGEVDRAICIHQNLITRPTLSEEQRTYALLELGLDYMRAGLLDRAESLFLELLELKAHVLHALRQLIDIYQQERDWEKAIPMAKQLESVSGNPQGPLIAHFYCELAEEAFDRGEVHEAMGVLKKALRHDPACVRVSLLEGRMALQRKDYDQAIRAYSRVERQDADYLHEVIQPLWDCYHAQGQEEALIAHLTRLLEHHGLAPALEDLVKLVQAHHGTPAAIALVADQLRHHPSLPGLVTLLDLEIAQGQESLRLYRDVLFRLLVKTPCYRCQRCGFSGKVLHWQCPSCRAWNTVKPVRASGEPARVPPEKVMDC